MMVEDPDFWHIVTFTDGRISKCHTWFQAYNELSVPGAAGTIKFRGMLVATRRPDGAWEWTGRSYEPGFDLDVED